jgi:hypothetical protein
MITSFTIAFIKVKKSSWLWVEWGSFFHIRISFVQKCLITFVLVPKMNLSILSKLINGKNNNKVTFYVHVSISPLSLSFCQRQDSNPWSYDYDSSDLPLCSHHMAINGFTVACFNNKQRTSTVSLVFYGLNKVAFFTRK